MCRLVLSGINYKVRKCWSSKSSLEYRVVEVCLQSEGGLQNGICVVHTAEEGWVVELEVRKVQDKSCEEVFKKELKVCNTVSEWVESGCDYNVSVSVACLEG